MQRLVYEPVSVFNLIRNVLIFTERPSDVDRTISSDSRPSTSSPSTGTIYCFLWFLK